MTTPVPAWAIDDLYHYLALALGDAIPKSTAEDLLIEAFRQSEVRTVEEWIDQVKRTETTSTPGQPGQT